MQRPVNRTVLYLVIVTLVAAIAAGANSIWYSNRVARESQHTWCALIVTLDEAYRAQPPTSPTGQKVAAELHKKRLELGCP